MYQPFDILFFKGDTIIGKLIRFVSKSEYSHVCMFLDQFHTLETAWNKPSIINHFSYKYRDYDIYRLNVQLNDYQKQIILQYITERINYKYDWLYAITRGLNLLFGTKIINSKNRFDCDELIYEAFKRVGIQLVENGEMLTPSVISKSKYLERVKL